MPPPPVAFSLDLVRHVCGRVLNAAEFPPAVALRFHLGQSGTLFGDLFLHLNRQYLDQEGKVVYTSKDGRTSESFPGMAGQPVFSYTEQGVSRWRGAKDYVTLSETSVQLVIITSIENRKPLTHR
jgi:hypothetical protein